MPSTFFGLEIGLRSLLAQQRAIDILNHNIANANTPGYSRQTANQVTTPPYSYPGINQELAAGQLGTGVTVDSILRVRDSLTDFRLRGELATQSYWGTSRDFTSQTEALFNEPAGTGLGALVDNFWKSWQDLANAPADTAVRATLVEQARSFASTINDRYRQLQGLQQNLDQQVEQTVGQVDDLAGRIASLNSQIAQVQATGLQANDLADQRDLLLSQLAGLVKVTTINSPTGDGTVQVFLDNRPLVDGAGSHLLQTTPGAGGLARVQWASDGSPVAVGNGSLQSLLDQRDSVLPQAMSQLDDLAATLIGSVNAVHAAGFGLDDPGPAAPGRLFFVGTGAADIAVNLEIVADPRKVAAASQPGAPGDGSRALDIADALKAAGIDGKYQTLVSRLGVSAQAADTRARSQDALVHSLQQFQQSISGVSLDEETVNLLKYQQAYQASARVITAVDQMLDTLINQTGIVGR